MKFVGKMILVLFLAGLFLPCQARPEEVGQALPQSAPHGERQAGRLPPRQKATGKKDGSGSGRSLRKPPATSSDGDEAAPPSGTVGDGGFDALEEELGRILDESVQEALAEQRKSFERDYSRLWDSRSFWRRVAVGEGGAIVACLLGGILVWNMGR